MSQVEIPISSSIVAIYPDHAAAERAVRRLHDEGFAMSDLSIIGRGLHGALAGTALGGLAG